jgi:hypothetical protein
MTQRWGINVFLIKLCLSEMTALLNAASKVMSISEMNTDPRLYHQKNAFSVYKP